MEIKIFIGFLQNREIQVHLKQSPLWNEEKLLRMAHLKETKWKDNDYIGFFLDSEIFYEVLKKKEEELKTQLQNYCPKLNLDKHSIHLFTQFFII